jgi:UDP-2,4-diacetamido-2,4,6-trideoxy-beta-L-altropyranose hydrolase
LTNSRPIAVFRADASAKLGGGHVMRCLVLADQLAARGWQCVFATSTETPATVPALLARHAVVAIETPEALAKQWPNGVDALIVDHYGLDVRFERACRDWARRIVVIDDLADREHDADILIDATLGRREWEYRQLVPESCRLLLGPAFALLRPEFARARPASLARDRSALASVFVGFGATDPDNLTGRLLPELAAALPQACFDVAIGGAAPGLRGVEGLAQKHARVRLHIGATNVASLMAGSDFAIGNAGTGAWERCALGVPSAAIVAAENQRAIARALAASGAAVAAEPDGLTAMLRGLAAATRLGMARAAATICDGLGAMRVAGLLEPIYTRDGKPVSLLPMTAADSDRVLGWQTAPGARRFSRNPAPPSPETHRRWFAARLADPGCIFNLIVCDGAPAGLLRFDRLSPDRDAFEVSILVAPEFQGRNVAGAALAQGRSLVPWAEFHAEVLPGNVASAALFTRMGYAHTLLGRYVARPQGDAA